MRLFVVSEVLRRYSFVARLYNDTAMVETAHLKRGIFRYAHRWADIEQTRSRDVLAKVFLTSWANQGLRTASI